MRLSYLLELVLAVAVGLALVRVRFSDPQLASTYPINANGVILWWPAPLVARVGWGVESLLAGAVLMGGLGTWAERVRGRLPQTWGPGRWVWSILGLSVVLSNLQIVINCFATVRITHFGNPILPNLQRSHADGFIEVASHLLLALGLTYLIARPRPGVAPDGREFAGRAVAVLIVMLWIATQILRLSGIPMYRQGGSLY